MREVYKALVDLAIHRHLTFSLTREEVLSPVKHSCVVVPPGDRRAEVFAAPTTGRVIEAPEMPIGVALLFPSLPEDTGRLVINGNRYGLAVWGAFYAVQFVTAGFQHATSIPIKPCLDD